MGAFYLGLVIRFRDELLCADGSRLSLGLDFYTVYKLKQKLIQD
jgi:hypothetical protein